MSRPRGMRVVALLLIAHLASAGCFALSKKAFCRLSDLGEAHAVGRHKGADDPKATKDAKDEVLALVAVPADVLVRLGDEPKSVAISQISKSRMIVTVDRG